ASRRGSTEEARKQARARRHCHVRLTASGTASRSWSPDGRGAKAPKHPGTQSMATYITEDCINCGACEPECPNEAISEGDEIYVIDPELCTECVGFYDHEACQAVCPVECCLPNPQIVETEEVLIARALKLHPDDGELSKRAAANDYPSRFRK